MTSSAQPTPPAPDHQGQPLVSVVVPCRNRAAYLRATIDSILHQDYPNIECIVMDGASTDGTVEILKSYGNRIQWRSEPDRGPADAINKGWQHCRGNILAWLNADDMWAEGAVTTAVAYFAAHPEADVVFGDCPLVDTQGQIIENDPRTRKGFDLAYCLEHTYAGIPQATSFFRHRIIERVGPLTTMWLHDFDLWLRIGLAGGVIRYHPAVLAYEGVHGDNVSRHVLSPYWARHIQRFYDRPDVPERLRRLRSRALSAAYYQGAECAWLSRQPVMAVEYVVRAVLADPTNWQRGWTYLRNRVVAATRLLATRRIGA